MKIPNRIKVGGITYQILIEPIERSESGNLLLGQTNNIDNTIRINSKSAPERQQQTFFHELMHAVAFESSNTELYDDERTIDSVGLMLYQVFMDNFSS